MQRERNFHERELPSIVRLCPAAAPVQTNAAKRSLEDCKDTTTFCGQWAAVGECDSNPVYMHANCPVTPPVPEHKVPRRR